MIKDIYGAIGDGHCSDFKLREDWGPDCSLDNLLSVIGISTSSVNQTDI